MINRFPAINGGKTMKKYEILLAQSDEDPYHPALIRWTLENRGYHVTAALGSEPAMQTLRKNDFDLVITDLTVVLEKNRELNSENTAILMLDAKSGMIPVRTLRPIADDYLFIPFELTELEFRVADGIERSKRKQREARGESHEAPWSDMDLDILTILSHDITGSLFSMSATLKLLSRGYLGEMDKGVKNGLEELLSQTVSLIRLTERYLGNFSSFPLGVENATNGAHPRFFNSQQVGSSLSVDPFFHRVLHSSPLSKNGSSSHKGAN